MAEEEFVEGWTKPIKHRLLGDNIPEDLTGMTLELVLIAQRSGIRVDTVGDISTTFVPQSGTVPAHTEVTFSPDPTDLRARDSPIEARYHVTDGSGKKHMYPNKEPDIWIVRR